MPSKNKFKTGNFIIQNQESRKPKGCNYPQFENLLIHSHEQSRKGDTTGKKKRKRKERKGKERERTWEITGSKWSPEKTGGRTDRGGGGATTPELDPMGAAAIITPIDS